ncbi:type I restriction enzyme EcoKI subunit R [Planctomycetes bacterium Pla86]|uniref:Type I restriction enzyme EcoKI subunit R n=1 Tax=Engelhardtia mirabilis TaxID=2528011 RepID=A0A518BE76_9BACT|nr:type I restriction enzyme EcoKI subunit R [Planctomycetes bacterium Pla133]QDU99613.1 type I restriction enzyme EcoKI subunit R [Planctomycetes bacterium Pla86]
MTAPIRGLHEALITEAIAESLRNLDPSLELERAGLRKEEAADRIAFHIGRVVFRALEGLPDKERVSRGVRLARDLVEAIDQAIGGQAAEGDSPIDPGEILHAVCTRLPDGTKESFDTPLLPLLDTTLLTNAPDEPRVGHQLLTEIDSADRIDIVMAFIRRTGIRPMLSALRGHCDAGRGLRVLTTTYTDSTELAALEQLEDLGAEIRVSYDKSTSRLHAKAWLFHRASGFTTAYVGSSNLTFSAQQSGLEWNARISGARNPAVTEKVAAVFESYWNSVDFRPFDAAEFEEQTERRDGGSELHLSPIEIHPFPFQERLLEQIALARQQGHHRNLLVSATGTGKTVIAAVDYARLKAAMPRARLLFVAHRKEILEQSLATFRHGLRDAAFGELWVGGRRPRAFEHLFASIQSLNAAGLEDLPPDHFDVVIVDEFHHAAAATYRRLLKLVRPIELLGLTATPERADGLSVLEHFDGRIAAELRLWQAIEQHRLCPFLYYGISDNTDLREVPWRRGHGYDIEGLSNVLTASDSSARLVLKQLQDHVDALSSVRCLGFCVSIAHAQFMARVFRESGVKATAIWGDTPKVEREAALRDLASGALQVLFSVDLFNEGVDLPTIDTVLFLRPTDSATLFLQQLGRGLRRSPGKTACTVLDFVGQHRKEFRFDRRFAGLFEGGRKRLIEHVKRGFPFLPAGCHMELDAVASQRVLENIKAAVPSRWAAKAEELRRIAAASADKDVTLGRFLEESGLALDDVYQGTKCWSDLRAEAGLPNLPEGPVEDVLRRACGRLRHVDDLVRIERYQALLANDTPPEIAPLDEQGRRLLRMLVASMIDQAVTRSTTLAEGAQLLWGHPQARLELRPRGSGQNRPVVIGSNAASWSDRDGCRFSGFQSFKASTG